MMRKGLEMESKSYEKEELQSSQMSLIFDFKIQCNQSISSEKSETIPTEVIIRNDSVKNDSVRKAQSISLIHH